MQTNNMLQQTLCPPTHLVTPNALPPHAPLSLGAKRKVMRVAGLILFGLIVLSGCATVVSYGNRLDASHELSMTELLGDSAWFDGEPVSTMGVVEFSFEFEGSSKLFSSQFDQQHDTYSYVILDLPPDIEAEAKRLQRFNGKLVQVSGVFHALERTRLPAPSENQGSSGVITICQGMCGAIGYIEVSAVSGRQ